MNFHTKLKILNSCEFLVTKEDDCEILIEMPRSLIYFLSHLAFSADSFHLFTEPQELDSYISECNRQLPENHLCNNYRSDLIIIHVCSNVTAATTDFERSELSTGKHNIIAYSAIMQQQH